MSRRDGLPALIERCNNNDGDDNENCMIVVIIPQPSADELAFVEGTRTTSVIPGSLKH